MNRTRRCARSFRALVFLAVGALAGCGDSDAPDDIVQPVEAPTIPRVVSAQEALSGAHIPTVDPVTMNDAEIRKVVEAGPRCVFRYTSSGKPVLAVGMSPDGAAIGGVVKLNGSLVPLKAAAAEGAGPADRLLLRAEPVQIAIIAEPGERVETPSFVTRREATMIFQVNEKMRVGYRGYLGCAAEPPVKPA